MNNSAFYQSAHAMSEQPIALPQPILDALACSRFLRRQLDSRPWLAERLAASIGAPLDATALRDAVAAILSNVFVTLKAGSKSRGYAIGHASALTDIFVPTTAKFTDARGLVYVVDASTTYFIPKSALVTPLKVFM